MRRTALVLIGAALTLLAHAGQGFVMSVRLPKGWTAAWPHKPPVPQRSDDLANELLAEGSNGEQIRIMLHSPAATHTYKDVLEEFRGLARGTVLLARLPLKSPLGEQEVFFVKLSAKKAMFASVGITKTKILEFYCHFDYMPDEVHRDAVMAVFKSLQIRPSSKTTHGN